MSKLKRELTLPGLTMIAIGSCIGAGIFVTPSSVAANLSTPQLILGVWAVGGLIALTGALTFAELGGMFPKAGGVYAYLKEGYGDLAAFFYGWAYFILVNSGALAALTFAFAYYVSYLVPLSQGGQTRVACAAIVTATLINILRVKIVEVWAGLFTGLKLLGIAAVVFMGIWLGQGGLGVPAPIDAGTVGTRDTLGAFGLALVSVFFSYGGWHHAGYLAGEAREAQRTIPRAMILGALVVTLTYLSINIAFMRLLGVQGMSESQAVAADALATVFPSGAALIAVLIAVSTFGTVLIYMLSAPRVYFAMAEDGLFFPALARVHPTLHTPVNAVLFQSAWAIILVLAWGTFHDAVKYVTFTDWIFFTTAACLVFVFRRTRPDAARPYRTFGYPFTPLIFVLISALFLVNMLIQEREHAYVALALLASGFPFYVYFKRKRASA